MNPFAVIREQTIFRLRDYCGNWMRLGYMAPKSRPGTWQECAHPPGPGHVFLLHFEGMLKPEDLWTLGERLCEEGERAMFDPYPSDATSESDGSREYAKAARAGQGTLVLEVPEC